ncbi:hypothetical protein D3C85_1244150 [compost metagenome]
MEPGEKIGAGVQVGCRAGGVLGLGVEGANLRTLEEALQSVQVIGTQDWCAQGRGEVGDGGGHQISCLTKNIPDLNCSQTPFTGARRCALVRAAQHCASRCRPTAHQTPDLR